MIKLKKGLDLPIAGAAEPMIDVGRPVTRVAILGRDYVGMKPTMKVKVGDPVQQGQILFEDKKNPGVVFTAPASGVVESINRGERRVFQSLVIACDPVTGAESAGESAAGVSFPTLDESALLATSRDDIVERLVSSGLWVALRTRPYSKVPAIGSAPAAIFVNAMDTNPLAVDPAFLFASDQGIGKHAKQDFIFGQRVLQRLTEGPVYVSASAKGDVPVSAGAQLKRFDGPHPAGLVGTHIHTLSPVNANRTVWHIGVQDVMAIGALCRTGQLDSKRLVALAGPQVNKPRVVSTVLGADLAQLTQDELKDGENRIISGSVLSGHAASEPCGFLGRYHQQVSVIREGRERYFMEYLNPGAKKHSVLPVFLSKWLGESPLEMTSTTNGSERGMVPVGSYEKVMPLDILPTQLLRSLIVGDTETAQALGCLELDEEDLGLCTYVCPGKYEFGPILRDNLTQIELDG